MIRLILLARRGFGLLRGCLLIGVLGLFLLGAGACTALGIGIGRGMAGGPLDHPNMPTASTLLLSASTDAGRYCIGDIHGISSRSMTTEEACHVA